MSALVQVQLVRCHQARHVLATTLVMSNCAHNDTVLDKLVSHCLLSTIIRALFYMANTVSNDHLATILRVWLLVPCCHYWFYLPMVMGRRLDRTVARLATTWLQKDRMPVHDFPDVALSVKQLHSTKEWFCNHGQLRYGRTTIPLRGPVGAAVCAGQCGPAASIFYCHHPCCVCNCCSKISQIN